MGGGENKEAKNDVTTVRPSREMNWPIVLYHIHLHVGALIGLYYVFTEARIITTIFGKIFVSYCK
jgi:hypothetical protein